MRNLAVIKRVAITVVIIGVLAALFWVVRRREHNGSQNVSGAERTMVLEVIQRRWGIERDERLVFLRVYSDGVAETHPQRDVDFRNVEYKRKQLSPEQLRTIESLVSVLEPEKEDEGSHFVRNWGANDFGYDWKVTLSQGREIELINFQPFLAMERKEPYPQQIVRLACLIWRLRVEVSGEHLDKDFVRGCNELGF